MSIADTFENSHSVIGIGDTRYWKKDGSNGPATGNWDLGTYNLTTTGTGTFGNVVFYTQTINSSTGFTLSHTPIVRGSIIGSDSSDQLITDDGAGSLYYWYYANSSPNYLGSIDYATGICTNFVADYVEKIGYQVGTAAAATFNGNVSIGNTLTFNGQSTSFFGSFPDIDYVPITMSYYQDPALFDVGITISNGGGRGILLEQNWIDMPTGGYSGIGSGGNGNNAWIVLAAIGSEWFGDSLGGDICYRNNNENFGFASARLLFGGNNYGGTSGMCLDSVPHTGDNSLLSVQGNLTVGNLGAYSTVGASGVGQITAGNILVNTDTWDTTSALQVNGISTFGGGEPNDGSQVLFTGGSATFAGVTFDAYNNGGIAYTEEDGFDLVGNYVTDFHIGQSAYIDGLGIVWDYEGEPVTLYSDNGQIYVSGSVGLAVGNEATDGGFNYYMPGVGTGYFKIYQPIIANYGISIYGDLNNYGFFYNQGNFESTGFSYQGPYASQGNTLIADQTNLGSNVVGSFSFAQINNIEVANVHSLGSGYHALDVVQVSGGNNNATLTINTVNGSGGVLTFSLNNSGGTTAGTGYSVNSNVATTLGHGTGFTIDITQVGDFSSPWTWSGGTLSHGTNQQEFETSSFNPTIGNYYLISFTLTGVPSNHMTFGGSSSISVAVGTWTYVIKATTTDPLVFVTYTSASSATFANLAVQQIMGGDLVAIGNAKIGGTLSAGATTLSSITTIGGVAPVADGTYTVGAMITPVTGTVGKITTKSGIITAIQQAT